MRALAKATLTRSLLFLCLALAVWGLGLPLSVDAILVVLMLLVAVLVQERNSAILLCSVIVSMGIAEASLRVMTRSNVMQTAYRMDDKYFGQGHYTPNVQDSMRMTFGDISAMDPLAPLAIRETRQVRFATDDFGFRNDHNYAGQRCILVGDSFVAATDSDQADTLGNVLARDFGLATYSLGFPGNPDDYVRACSRFLHEKSRDVRFVLFVFEGNDLSCSSRQRKKMQPSDLPWYDQVKLRYATVVHAAFGLPLTVFNMASQVRRMFRADTDAFSETYKVGPHYVGFYGPYIDAALFEHCSFELHQPDEEVLSRVAMVFFIPTKYRVYFDFLKDQGDRRLPSPASGFASLRDYCQARGIAAYDLTPALTQAAARLLPQGRYVFWRDDTHWNPEGIRAAAAVVAEKLGGVLAAEAQEPDSAP